MAGEVVGWLQILVAGEDVHGCHGSHIEICGNEQFYLGRDAELCRYTWCDDLTISRLHLRIHCILYEQDPISDISPFLYATDLSANGTYLKKSNVEYAASQDDGVLMGRKNTFLLDAGDELHISENITLIYISRSPVKTIKLTPTQEVERQMFSARYLVTSRMLGAGGYGKVLVGVHQQTQRQLACKIVRLDEIAAKASRLPTADRKKHVSSSRERCFREFDILKDLSHPNIISVEKVFCSRDNIYIFQELITGGDLFSFLEFKGGRLNCMQTAAIVYQVLKGIEYLHRKNVVHRDLKPDNILMSSLEAGARVVITDFGNARFIPDKTSQPNKYQRMFSYVGTLEYAAPEIHRANPTIPVERGYSKSVDMWSIGALTATVLSGDHLFTDRTHPDYDRNAQRVIVSLAAVCNLSVLDDHHHPLWKSVGPQPKDFIRKLLVLREEDRMTASNALAHPWFTCYAKDVEEVYKRSIADWKPHQKNHRLVEDINKLSLHSVTNGASAVRENTNSYLHGMQDSQGTASSLGRGKLIHSPANQLSHNSAAPADTYNNRPDSREGFVESAESFNVVSNHHSQQECLDHRPPFMGIRLENDLVQVSETPTEEYEYPKLDNKDGCVVDQMYHPEHRKDKRPQQKTLKRKNVSVLVPETPPKLSPKYARLKR